MFDGTFSYLSHPNLSNYSNENHPSKRINLSYSLDWLNIFVITLIVFVDFKEERKKRQKKK